MTLQVVLDSMIRLPESTPQPVLRALRDRFTIQATGDLLSTPEPLRKGATAIEAAARIHSDIAKHFIRAEVIAYDDYIACGGETRARERGKLRLEGKDYVVQDGDIMHFRHSG